MHYLKEDPTSVGSPIRPEDNQNIDQLIPKLNFFFYANRNTIHNIDTIGGILTPNSLLKKFPGERERIEKIYGDILSCDILSNSVLTFLARVPKGLPNTDKYLEKNIPVRISVNKLLKAKYPYKAYIFNIPNREPNEVRELSMQEIDKLNKMEDKWYNAFKNSKDQYFRDVPQVAIFCGDSGMVPTFSCKILKGE